MAEAAKLPPSGSVESQPQAGTPNPGQQRQEEEEPWEHQTKGIRGVLSVQETGLHLPSEGVPLFSADQLEKFTLDSSCWRGCVTVSGSSGGVCKLHPAVTLRDLICRDSVNDYNCGLGEKGVVSPTLKKEARPYIDSKKSLQP